jgi:hypothetical protein
MLYIPGLGYIPLSNFPGLGGAGRGAGGPAAAPPNPEGEREWSGLREFPGATQEGLLNAVNALKQDGRTEMTLLVLGKGGVGKSRCAKYDGCWDGRCSRRGGARLAAWPTLFCRLPASLTVPHIPPFTFTPPPPVCSTINSLLNERVANVTAFQQDVAKPTQYSRRAAGFTLHCIDTPSVLDQDNVSDAVSGQAGWQAGRVRLPISFKKWACGRRLHIAGAQLQQQNTSRRSAEAGAASRETVLIQFLTPHPPGGLARPVLCFHLCLQKLEAIGKAVKGQRVDAVLYLDRLDSYKLDTLDRKVCGHAALVIWWWFVMVLLPLSAV